MCLGHGGDALARRIAGRCLGPARSRRRDGGAPPRSARAASELRIPEPAHERPGAVERAGLDAPCLFPAADPGHHVEDGVGDEGAGDARPRGDPWRRRSTAAPGHGDRGGGVGQVVGDHLVGVDAVPSTRAGQVADRGVDDTGRRGRGRRQPRSDPDRRQAWAKGTDKGTHAPDVAGAHGARGRGGGSGSIGGRPPGLRTGAGKPPSRGAAARSNRRPGQLRSGRPGTR